MSNNRTPSIAAQQAAQQLYLQGCLVANESTRQQRTLEAAQIIDRFYKPPARAKKKTEEEPPKNRSWFAVLGRIPGTDEDSCFSFYAMDATEAAEAFTKEIYAAAASESEVEAYKKQITELWGEPVYITGIIRSRSKVFLE